jgi:hypothetical protein
MKKVVLVVLVSVGIVGCSSTPKLSGYEGPKALASLDVIKYNKACVGAGMKPNVEYVVKKTDSGKVLVPINVHCEPYPEKK